jgi:hypothetical protein
MKIIGKPNKNNRKENDFMLSYNLATFFLGGAGGGKHTFRGRKHKVGLNSKNASYTSTR